MKQFSLKSLFWIKKCDIHYFEQGKIQLTWSQGKIFNENDNVMNIIIVTRTNFITSEVINCE